MSDEIELVVEPRERAGKGSARAARRAGLIPAVIYGDKKEPIMVTIERNMLMRLINRGEFVNKLFNVTVGGDTSRVLTRDLQKDPVTDEPMHVDLLRLGKGTVMVFEVPMRFINEEESVGIKHGGVLNIVRHTIEIRCRAKDLPEFLEVDLLNMDIGDSAHGSTLALPADTELAIADRDFTIATMAAPTVEVEPEVEEDEEGEEGIEGEEGAEGAEGAEGEAADDATGDKAKE